MTDDCLRRMGILCPTTRHARSARRLALSSRSLRAPSDRSRNAGAAEDSLIGYIPSVRRAPAQMQKSPQLREIVDCSCRCKLGGVDLLRVGLMLRCLGVLSLTYHLTDNGAPLPRALGRANG